VLVAMGVPNELSRGAIRFSLGRETTETEIDTVVTLLIEKLRKD
jgi:cysteine desulfurase